MTKRDLEKLSKAELFELEKELRKEKRDPLREKSDKDLKKEMDAVKHVLYECSYCAKATTSVVKDGNFEEYEYFVADCGKTVCPYRAEFLKMSKQEEKKREEINKEISKYA